MRRRSGLYRKYRHLLPNGLVNIYVRLISSTQNSVTSYVWSYRGQVRPEKACSWIKLPGYSFKKHVIIMWKGVGGENLLVV